MAIPKNETSDISLTDWYINYLTRYMKLIDHPRFSKEKREKYWFKLIEWEDNWGENLSGKD